ncbi:hypothetical protein BXU11_14205 [Flavobacterium sp. LM5]|uniref:YVTN family beta-propeller repeat protein n=1 Tax=Flavobacterium sp. LM5 TaxID=1938610 RepID=UPI000992FFFB|nr:hypothetical protein [Flavobacterium sp. LM5]OOV25819.1 hypothetical protein BXU11_14205 [Flavobacterium sp. LM5]
MSFFKKIVLLLGVICLVFGMVYIIKQPKYSIKTEGKLYVVNKASRSITVFDLEKGEEIKELPIAIEPHEATALTNPNRIVVTNYGAIDAKGKSITVIDAEKNTIIKTIDLGNKNTSPHGIITLESPNKVAVVSDDGNHLSVVNIESGKVEKQIATQQKVSHLLVKHPFKPIVYVTNINSGSVTVVAIESNKVVQIIPCGKSAEGIAITKDGSEIWVSNNKENYVSVINTLTYKEMARLATGKEPLRVKFSIDGKYGLVANASEGTISVFDTQSKKLFKTIVIPGNKNVFEKIIYRTPRPVGILMHPNGLYAFVSNYTAGRVEVIDMQNFTISSSIKVGNMPDGLAIII